MPLQSCKAQKPSGAQDCSRLEPRIASVPERSREFFANLTASKKAAGTVKPFALLRRCCLRVLIYSHTMVFSNGKGLTPISPQIPFLSNQLRYLWNALLTSTTLRDSSHQSKLSKCKLHLYKCDPSAAMQPMTKCSTIAHKPDPVSASSIQSSLGLASSLRHVHTLHHQASKTAVAALACCLRQQQIVHVESQPGPDAPAVDPVGS